MKAFIDKYSWWRVAAVCCILAFSVVTAVSSLYREFDHDEFEAIHSAWLIFSGETIYVDFFQHHHFLFYYFLTPLFSIFGEEVSVLFAARGVMLALLFGIVWMTYKIGALLHGKDVALLATFLLLTTVMFMDKAIEIRPDVPFVFCSLVSVFLFLQYRLSHSARYLMGSILFLFVAFLFLQKAVFFAAALGILFLFELFKKNIGWREIMSSAVFSLSLLLGFFYYVSSVFGWQKYFLFNWELNTELVNRFPFYEYILRSLPENPLLWLLFALGLLFLLWQRRVGVAGVFSFVLLGSVVLVKSPFPQYYLMALPFMAIVGAILLVYGAQKYSRLTAIALVLSTLWSGGVVWHEWEGNEKQLAKVKYVLSLTTPDDLVYDGDTKFNLFRKDIDYFWFSVEPKKGGLAAYQSIREYPYDPYTLIQEKRPKIVSDSFVKTKHPAIASSYTESELFDGLYIRE